MNEPTEQEKKQCTCAGPGPHSHWHYPECEYLIWINGDGLEKLRDETDLVMSYLENMITDGRERLVAELDKMNTAEPSLASTIRGLSFAALVESDIRRERKRTTQPNARTKPPGDKSKIPADLDPIFVKGFGENVGWINAQRLRIDQLNIAIRDRDKTIERLRADITAVVDEPDPYDMAE